MIAKDKTVKLSEGSGQPSTLVRPSSLNYKISLSEAVIDFIKKDMPLLEDQYIDVQAEEPKAGGSAANHSSKAQSTPHVNAPGEAYEDFDDIMFDMTTPNMKTTHTAKSKNHPATPYTNSTTYINDTGQSKDAWFREEDLMRKKLEKNAINQLKSRIAQ